MNDQPQAPVQNQEKTQNGFFDGNPKMLFTFGLVTGIALTLLLNNFAGVAIAAPSRAANNNGGGVAVTNPTANDTATAPSGELAPVTKDDHVRGDLKKAKVVMIEYSDFQCLYCQQHHPNLQKVMDDYGDQVAWVYRHFPLSFHPNAEPAANASECASEQGKFWEYADALFENQEKESDSYYAQLAGDLGLNVNKFNDCYSAKKYQAVIDSDAASGATAGVNGTPATFINGQLISGAVPYTSLKAVIDSALAEAN